MRFLLDTNVLSELRKGARSDRRVREWFDGVADTDIFLSVLVVGELRRGVELLRRRDPQSARHLDHWLQATARDYAPRILPVTRETADLWGRLGVPDPVPTIDGLMAATAIEHGLTLVTRNVQDVLTTGVPTLNPFD